MPLTLEEALAHPLDESFGCCGLLTASPERRVDLHCWEPPFRVITKAVALCRRLELFVLARSSALTCQVAWVMLQKCISHALDFDNRVCPSWALREERSKVDFAVSQVVDAIAGCVLDPEARAQCALPGPLGGTSLRDGLEVYSQASFAVWS